MTINYDGRQFAFRGIDTKGMTTEEVSRLAKEQGETMFDPHNGNTYLLVEGVGYGMEVRDYIEEL